jgi:hypothetical protein
MRFLPNVEDSRDTTQLASDASEGTTLYLSTGYRRQSRVPGSMERRAWIEVE